ncbi:hypothetical protein ACQP04_11165 [Pseudonocardia halophobica]|uniref:hypothetical protein n=1 Tax=Pseudonocardia halophobica TaxID=29401 RepID=UPI003D949337
MTAVEPPAAGVLDGLAAPGTRLSLVSGALLHDAERAVAVALATHERAGAAQAEAG